MSLVSAGGGPRPVGAVPRADLLPPEVEESRKAKRVRGNSIAAIILALVLVIGAYGGVTVLTLDAENRLAVANERTQFLLTEQSKYAEVRMVTGLLAAAKAGLEVGTSTEIDWQIYLQRIQSLLPPGTVITNFRAETASPLNDFQQPNVPLQGDRIGELSFTARTPGLPQVEQWLISLRELPGFVDAAPGSVTLGSDGEYRVSITMHIDVGAYLNRYDPENPGKPGVLPGTGADEEDAAAEADETGSDADADADAEDEGEEG